MEGFEQTCTGTMALAGLPLVNAIDEKQLLNHALKAHVYHAT